MQQAWDKNGRIYYIDDNGNRVQPKTTKNAFERLGMQAKAGLGNLNRWLQNADTNSQSYKDKVNVALGLLTAPIGGSSALAAKGAGALTPFVGRKIAQNIASGAVGGATGGAVEGFGRGLVEQKNPIKTAVQDGTIGLVTGALGGAAGGKIGQVLDRRALGNNTLAPEQYFADYVEGLSNNTPLGQVSRYDKGLADFRLAREGNVAGGKNILLDEAADEAFRNEMKNFNLINYLPEEIKPLRKRTKNYYKGNLKPQDAIRDDMNNIKFTNSGINEQVTKGLHNIDVIPELREQIEQGIKQSEPRYDYARNDIDRFHIINNKFKNRDMEYQIAEDINGNRFYFAKDITNNTDLLPANRNQNPAPKTSPTNSITDNNTNFNPNANLYDKLVDNYNPEIEQIPKGHIRFYRGLQEEFNPNYNKSKLDNVNGYESWTDNYELAKAYGDNVYYIDLPESTITRSIIDENPKSMTYGDRNLIYEHDKPAGIKGKNGKEYMLYTYHENYPEIKYNKFNQ